MAKVAFIVGSFFSYIVYSRFNGYVSEQGKTVNMQCINIDKGIENFKLGLKEYSK